MYGTEKMEKTTENVLKEYLDTLEPDQSVVSALEIEDLFVDAPLSAREMDEAFQFLHKQGIEVTIDAQKLFEQTAQALASAIDAKDSYTNGHSHRVAYYSVKIAEELGLPKDECDRIYFAALLHDVGKIGVPIEILSKPGRLTDEEFDQIKQHPVVGGQILASISQAPWLSIGARYHHERYDGRGYPDGLKGQDIPEIARIIGVADAYDAMTSKRSYRDAIPQHLVREEIVKGMGTQFDPDYAVIMLHLIDLDTEYHMQEVESGAHLSPETVLDCKSIYHDCSEGIAITKKETLTKFYTQTTGNVCESGGEGLPSLIIFDSLDEKVHPGEEDNKDLLYYEYAQIQMDGRIVEGGIRKSEVTISDNSAAFEQLNINESEHGQCYAIYAVRYKDHALIRIMSRKKTIQVILALPDNSRFAYMSLSGENCCIRNISVKNSEKEIGPESIPRIAEEISFIKDKPQGDVPNVQVDNWRTSASEGIPIGTGMTLTFHSMSLPTARLVWHCPYISVFTSDNGQVNGDGFRECMLLRLDGENWESDDYVDNEVFISKTTDFAGWNEWIDKNKQGIDCVVMIRRERNKVFMYTRNLGIVIHSITTIHDEVDNLFVALTGDQVAITNIHVIRDHSTDMKQIQSVY